MDDHGSPPGRPDPPLSVTDGYRTDYDSERVGAEIVSSVAAVEGVRERTLPPLDTAVDSDALEALFAPTNDGTPRSGGLVSFRYAGHDVVVSSEGWIVVSTE